MEDVRERVGRAYPLGLDAVVGLVSALVAQLESVSARLAVLEAESAVLRPEHAALRARLGTNSHNSSKPPSSDGPGAKPQPRSQRQPSGRRPGGQPGHQGPTLPLIDDPDEVHLPLPEQCHACGRSLECVPATRRERRQLVDLPPVPVRVIEQRAETKRCPGCGVESSGEFPEGVVAPAQYGPRVATLGAGTRARVLNQEQLLPLERTGAVLAEVFGCPISEGTWERAVGDCHERLADTEVAIKQGVEAAAVAHFDETGLTIAGRTAWLHVASPAHRTYDATPPRRGREAMDAIGGLAQFRGRAMHDGWNASRHHA